MVDDLEAAVAAETASGNACVTRGVYGFGAKFAFIDARGATGGLVQLIERHFVLTQLTGAMRDAAAAWDRSSLTATLK